MQTKQNSRRRRNHRPQPLEVLVVVVFGGLVLLLGFILTAGIAFGKRDPLSAAYTYAMQTKQAMDTQPTPTPFQPLAGSESIQTQGTPEANTNSPALPTPTVRKLQKPEGQVNILLLGSDARPNEGGFRTDIIVWVSLNPKDDFVSAVSFPRDLFVQIPGMGENRINTAFPYGGFELMADTFELNFGVRPDHYVLVDFNGFVTVINNLGGIYVNAAQNLTDSCASWVNASGTCSVGPGTVHMNGDLALWYARSRYTSNDIERARRAQEVIEGIFDRLMSLDIILKAPELYNAYLTYVQTDLELNQVVSLLPLASKIKDNRDIRNYVVGYELAYDWITWQGAQVLVPDTEGIRQLMIEALALY